MSRNFSGAVVDSVGSVQCQIVPFPGLYLFSRSIVTPHLNTLSIASVAYITSRVVPPSLFILASFVCKSIQCLISNLTQGGEGVHVFRLTCSVVLWGWRDTANKYHWHVWGVLTVNGPHWVCHSPRQHITSKVQTAQVPVCSARALSQLDLVILHLWCLSHLGSHVPHKGTEPRWAVCFVPFPGPNHSGDWELGECTVPGGPCILCNSLLGFMDVPWGNSSRCAMHLLLGADRRLWHSWQMWTIQDTRNT